ncbi:hypothetical protein [Xanthomonas axonopodis]
MLRPVTKAIDMDAAETNAMQQKGATLIGRALLAWLGATSSHRVD